MGEQDDDRTPPSGGWVGTAAASALLGVTPRTMYRLIDTDGLPAYKFGRVIRLRRDDITAYIERSKIEPGTLGHLYPETSPTHEARRM